MVIHKFGLKVIAIMLGSALLAGHANAAETVTYQYDALGRLVATTGSGANLGTPVTTIQYDAAGNRINYTTVGAVTTSNNNFKYVIVPMLGLSLIKIN